MLNAQPYSKAIKKVLKPPARALAKVVVWLILLVNFYLFHSKRNHVPALLASLCFNDSLVFKTNLERLKYHIHDPDSMPENMFVWSGEWDRDIILTEEHEKFVMIRDFFVENKNYRDTRFYSFATGEMLKGEPLQRGDILLDSEENIILYFKKYKKLFAEIKNSGFNPDLAPEVGVVIDRNGRLLYFRQGHHSHAIGKIMGIKNITIRIRAVHSIWLSKQVKSGSGLHLLESIHRGFKNLFD
jgi:hypothetical protein